MLASKRQRDGIKLECREADSLPFKKMSSITRRKKKPLLRLIKKFARSTYNWYQEEEWGTHGTEEYRQNTRHT